MNTEFINYLSNISYIKTDNVKIKNNKNIKKQQFSSFINKIINKIEVNNIENNFYDGNNFNDSSLIDNNLTNLLMDKSIKTNNSILLQKNNESKTESSFMKMADNNQPNIIKYNNKLINYHQDYDNITTVFNNMPTEKYLKKINKIKSDIDNCEDNIQKINRKYY